MKEIIIGRDASTGKLRITIEGKSINDGSFAKPPQSVSKEHFKLVLQDNGKTILKNLNMENDTFVNGRAVESKVIHTGDQIELGKDHYIINWNLLSQLVPKIADISFLDDVWSSYQTELLGINIRKERFAIIRSISGVVMPIATCISIVMGRENKVYLIILVSVALFAIVTFVISYIQTTKVPQLKDELKEKTKQKFRCPSCEGLIVLQDPDLLSQKKCSHCGALFRKEL